MVKWGRDEDIPDSVRPETYGLSYRSLTYVPMMAQILCICIKPRLQIYIMKSSYVLVLLIIGIVILHAIDDRKDRKTEKNAKKASLVKKNNQNPSIAKPAVVASF